MKIEDYSKYYIQGSDHYLIPKNDFRELYNEMVNWKKENKKQKEVIDKAIAIYDKCTKTQDFSTCDLDMYEVLKGSDK